LRRVESTGTITQDQGFGQTNVVLACISSGARSDSITEGRNTLTIDASVSRFTSRVGSSQTRSDSDTLTSNALFTSNAVQVVGTSGSTSASTATIDTLTVREIGRARTNRVRSAGAQETITTNGGGTSDGSV